MTDLEKAHDASVSPSELGAAQTSGDWRGLWREAAQSGLLKRFMPSGFGGDAETATDFTQTMLAFGKSCPDNGVSMGLNSHVWTIQQLLVAFGSDAQKARYLPDLMSGAQIGAFALTEAGAGSDALSLSTHAVPRDGGYVLNGSKTFIGMGPVCDLAIVFASTAPEHKSWGLSAFIVEASDVGFHRLPPQEKMGLRALPMGPIELKECWVPQDRLIARAGSGARIIQTTLDWERSFILAPHVGAMARQLEACTAFCHNREVFGQRIEGF